MRTQLATNLRRNINFCVTFIFYLQFVILNSASAQNSISGKVLDDNASPLPFANVLILSAQDSSLIKGELSNDVGEYLFSNVKEGNYLISSSYIGYNTSYSSSFNIDANSNLIVDDLILSSGLELNEINVTAKKPLYEQKIDRLVVNVSNSITSAGGTALEVLERSPGVIVNQQSNAISLVGKEGVVIMINGKISYQPASSIVQMLDGMASDNIESIELITTPPANLDAEGNAGYINIILKQRTDLGLSGNGSASIGYGEGGTGSTGLNLNYRKGIVNVYSNYNFLYKAQRQVFDNYRKVVTPNGILESELVTDRDPQQVNHNFRIGADLQLSEKTVMGVLFSAYDNKWSMNAENNSSNSINEIVDNNVFLQNNEVNRWKHFGANFNLEQKIGSKGKLNLNFDYLSYNDNNPNEYEIDFIGPSGSLLSEEDTRSAKVTPINIIVGQLDYNNSINDKTNYMVGLKLGHSEFINTVSAETLTTNGWEFLDQFTNESDLEEDIAAVFASVDYNPSSTNKFKFGLRYEYTDSKLNTIKEGEVVNRQFGVFFPSIFYSRSLNDNQSINLSYSKRITRPTFNDMAPFAIFLDPNTFFFGNASLQPAITNNVKVDYRYKSYLISVQYSKEDSTIARFQDRIDVENNQQLFEPTNLSNTTTYSGSLSIPIYIGNRYTIQNNLIVLYTASNSFYNDTPINLTNTSYNLNSTHSISLNDNHSFELNGFYNSAAIFGRSVINPIYGINLGVQKKFSNGSALRFNIRDILNSIEFSGGTDIPSEGFVTDGTFDFSNRTFSLSYSYNFGNNKLESSRQRSTGSEEERNRVN